ncbi:MAG: type IV toxin-antitoxin system AbiEi family antitoxin domain-containing protein [Lachnospiraceae bacterium]|nr:type IV toxin-antitoxin system AbiEi family antitoxin domain-containing protein [Lachnospiraceae bacterium]
MLKDTYEKCRNLSTKYKGYIGTSDLLREGLTNRQIAEFVSNGMLEKVYHGVYWFSCAEYKKPSEYKAIEIGKSNSKAVVCADSACFYQGLIDVEPPVVSVATSRNDRSKLAMNFPISRHYYSDSNFKEQQQVVHTEFGDYIIYGVERSVCDCIRFKDDIDESIFCLILENYKKQEQTRDRLLQYARKLRMVNQLGRYL